MPPSIYVTPHFRWHELACHDGTQVPARFRANAERLCCELEELRDYLGGAPITILSGYRSPTWNARVKGAKGSQHLRAAAADIIVAATPPARVAYHIEHLIAAGRMRDGGLGRYRGFVHYDIGPARRWRG